MKNKFIVLLILLFSFSETGFAYDLNNLIETDDGFKIRLPPKWTPIPKDVLSLFNEQMPPNVKWDYSYQDEKANNWFEYPYILIRVNNSGKVSTTGFQEYKKPIDENINKELNNAKTTNDADEIKQIEKHFDDQNFVSYSTTRVIVKDIGPVIFKSIAVFTEKGSIDVSCYIDEKRYEKYSPLFDKILQNFEVSEALKYKKKEHTFFEQIPEYKKVITNAVGAGILVLLYSLYKRKKKIG